MPMFSIRPPDDRCALRARERNADARTAASIARADRRRAAVPVDDLLYDRKSQARAVPLGAGDPIEALEYVASFLGQDSRPGVLDTEVRHAFTCARGDGDR